MSNIEKKLISLESVWFQYREPSLLFAFAKQEKEPDISKTWALQDVSLEVLSGEFLGLIGNNGSGKSTLLKIISGVAFPVYGQSIVHGKVASLLELGAAFDPEATGRENMMFSCLLQGISQKKIPDLLEEMVDFADIGGAIDNPVKSYSSGMYARVAFSSKIFFDVDLIILDEILAVGDSGFIHKSLRKLQKMRDSGTSFIFVSHDMTAIKTLTTRVAWIHNGAKVRDGYPSEVVDEYLIFTHEKRETPFEEKEKSLVNPGKASNSLDEIIDVNLSSKTRRGNRAAQLRNLKISGGKDDKGTCLIEQGQNLSITGSIFNFSVDPDSDLLIGVTLRNNKGVDLASVNTDDLDIDLTASPQNTETHMKINLSFPILHPGQYSLSINLAEKAESGQYTNLDTLPDFQIIEIFGAEKVHCYWKLECSFTFT